MPCMLLGSVATAPMRAPAEGQDLVPKCTSGLTPTGIFTRFTIYQ
jgi:hypothetical protein